TALLLRVAALRLLLRLVRMRRVRTPVGGSGVLAAAPSTLPAVRAFLRLARFRAVAREERQDALQQARAAGRRLRGGRGRVLARGQDIVVFAHGWRRRCRLDATDGRLLAWAGLVRDAAYHRRRGDGDTLVAGLAAGFAKVAVAQAF